MNKGITAYNYIHHLKNLNNYQIFKILNEANILHLKKYGRLINKDNNFNNFNCQTNEYFDIDNLSKTDIDCIKTAIKDYTGDEYELAKKYLSKDMIEYVGIHYEKED